MSISLALATGSREQLVARARPCTEADPDGIPPLRVLGPGQLWLIEAAPAEAPTDRIRCAIAAASVVIYDRELAPLVAAILPLGGYAEAAAATDGAVDKVAERCVRFARDGWSVVRLVAAECDRVTVVIDGSGGAAPRLHAVAANGLAG